MNKGIKKVTYDDAVNDRMHSTGAFAPRIVGLIPAHNEQDSIADVLKSISKQTIPDKMELDVYIALDKCSDDTEKVIHQVNQKLGLNLFLLETVNNVHRKSGALNQLYQLFFGNPAHPAHKKIGGHQQKYADSIVAFIGMDADVILGKNCIYTLYNELQNKHNIGAVSANYTCLMPESPRKILRNDPEREYLIRSGKFGNWISRQWCIAQGREFASHTLRQKYHDHFAEICGGQCSIFRPATLKDVMNTYHLEGVFDDKTDTEDLLLTQYIRACGWECMISDSARCYVDPMRTLHTFSRQRNKWVSGTIDFMLESGLSTKYSRILWLQEGNLFINFVIRIMFVVLFSIAVLTNQFVWNWIWISPIVAASILNVILTVKTPNHRFIDIILAGTLINPELYLWASLGVHTNVWLSRFRVSKKDGWAMQYAAEAGQTHSKLVLHMLFVLAVIAAVSLLIRYNYDYIASDGVREALEPYLEQGFVILTILTIFEFFVMLIQIWRLRAPFKA